MTEEEWSRIFSDVADRMNDHVRSFVMPMSHASARDVRLVGTGTFIRGMSGTMIITCEHVAREVPLNFRPHGREEVYCYGGEWKLFAEPIDAAWTTGSLAAPVSPAKVVQPHQVAMHHDLAQPEELLFFYGYSDENSSYGFGVHQTNGIGYVTQQNRDAKPGPNAIELLWPNGKHEWSEGTTEEVRRKICFDNPAGFSGSLVWNTRFLETGGDLKQWTPDQAVVTALLKRFVPNEGILLASPIEAVRTTGGFVQL